MLDVVEAGLNGLRMMPCPACGQRALGAEDPARGVCAARCGRCDACFDAVAEVLVAQDLTRMRGDSCCGYRRHELRWRTAEGEPEQTTRFETWAQDHLALRPGDSVTLLFRAGELGPAFRGRPMPLMVGNHTQRRVWALVGSVPVATLRQRQR